MRSRLCQKCNFIHTMTVNIYNGMYIYIPLHIYVLVNICTMPEGALSARGQSAYLSYSTGRDVIIDF